MPMETSEKVRLRNFRIRYLDMRIVDGTAVVRAHCSCDCTKELAERMGWDLYTRGHLVSGFDGASLAGTLRLDEIAIVPNGKAEENAVVECVATDCDDFKLARFKGETEGVTETEIRFILRSIAWQQLTEHYGVNGEMDGLLVLTLSPVSEDGKDARQTTLDMGGDEKAEEADETEASPDEPVPDFDETEVVFDDTETASGETEAPEAETVASHESRVINGGRNLVSHRGGRGKSKAKKKANVTAGGMEVIQ